MAGEGYRIWTPGEVLTAEKIQDFLQDQTVQVYANSAARGSALSGYLSEGMMSYLEDTNQVQVYNGSSWVAVSGTVPSATPIVAGIVFGRTDGAAVTDTGTVALGANAAGSAVINPSFTGNIAIGYNAFRQGTGAANTAIGINAMNQTTTGIINTGVGIRSLFNVSSGGYNTAIGADAGFDTTTGSNNTSLGFDANPSSATSSNEVTLGNENVQFLRCQVTTITGLSDERDKKDIEELPVGLDFIRTLKPVKFTWNTRIPAPKTMADGTVKEYTEADVKRNVPDIGFIAQDLVEVEDELDAHDYLQLTLRSNPDKLEATPGRLIPILVKAIQELSAKVEALEARN